MGEVLVPSSGGALVLSNSNTNGMVAVDALRFECLGPLPFELDGSGSGDPDGSGSDGDGGWSGSGDEGAGERTTVHAGPTQMTPPPVSTTRAPTTAPLHATSTVAPTSTVAHAPTTQAPVTPLPTASPGPIQAFKRIAIIGDSITTGYYSHVTPFGIRLNGLLPATMSAMSFGVNGATFTQAPVSQHQFRFTAKYNAALASEPDLVVFVLGKKERKRERVCVCV